MKPNMLLTMAIGLAQASASINPVRTENLRKVTYEILPIFLSALAVIALFPQHSAFGQVPVGCQGNGLQGSFSFCNDPPLCSSLSSSKSVYVGDTLFYELEAGIQNGRCSATNVNAFVKFPDGRVIQFLSGAFLQGSSSGQPAFAIRCPGDPQCINTNQYFYTVRAQDIGSNFCVTAMSTLRGDAILHQSCTTAGANQVGTVIAAVGVSESYANGQPVNCDSTIGADVITPRITATIRFLEIELCWETVANRAYRVQYRSDLTANLWLDLISQTQGNGSTLCIRDSALQNEPQRFYRLKILP